MKQQSLASAVPKNFRRTLPFLKILQKSKPRVNKIDLLKKFPEFVTNDIVELLHNVLVGNVKIHASQKKKLAKHRRAMHTFANLGNLKKRRSFIYKQKGGFLMTILPLLASILGKIL